MTNSRKSSSDFDASIATILGRGVITSRTVLSPNATTDWMSLRSSFSMMPSSSPAEMSASMSPATLGTSGLTEPGSASSTNDSKNPRMAASGRTSKAQSRSTGAKGSSQCPLVLRYSNCAKTYVDASMLSHENSAASKTL